MKLKLALLVGLFAFGYAMSASAGAVVDSDGDLVPNQFDNCAGFPIGNANGQNGPNQASNQVDSDLDGYGNRCDADFDNDGATTVADFGQFLATFGGAATETDLDGDLAGTVADFGIFLSYFNTRGPGPSGLGCVSLFPATPCVP